ncbi:MAG TPA: AbrB/MazE/SpoVT family DNA-binding domain-containing protein [Longimicrobium sp.]|jgi:bifunctional DNA-binding transcriptional regulator/antitoxin component of YhaV-PrlF toxin-antitoxin module|nr:AbrB/MazE/SpoVT family DNA-binding domain-containing protein [Longimicrobium sp.]
MLEYLLFVRENADGLYIRIPADVADRLDAHPGERVELTEVDGGFILSAIPKPDPEEERRNYGAIMRAFEKIRTQYDGALRRLTDS